ncbi:MAG: hypothetical protein IH792_01935 [Thaumarchaeota archaeon]|nr:hypothetical protein [Nitrososphaerota archaeon]
MKKLLLLVAFSVLFSSLNIDQAMAGGTIFDVFFDIEVSDSANNDVQGAECTISDPGKGILVSGFTDRNGDVQLQIMVMAGQVLVECTSGSTVKNELVTITSDAPKFIEFTLPQVPQVPQVVGGEIIPIETTSLLLVGAQSSFIWILPIVLVGAGFSAYKLRHRF